MVGVIDTCHVVRWVKNDGWGFVVGRGDRDFCVHYSFCLLYILERLLSTNDRVYILMAILRTYKGQEGNRS